MRWFFGLLVFTNLALAGWFYWQDQTQPPERVLTKSAPDQGRLKLLSELPPQSLQTISHKENTTEIGSAINAPGLSAGTIASEQTKATEVHTEAKVDTCMQIKPFAGGDDIELFKHKISQADITFLSQGEEFSERVTFWVMIPPYKTAKAAREAGSMLAKAKVRDFLMVHSGEFKNGISLGLFSQKEGAESRLQEVLALNLDIHHPEVRRRTSEVRSNWLMVHISGMEANVALQQEINAEGLLSSPVGCPP